MWVVKEGRWMSYRERGGNDISCKSETERVGQIIPTCLGRKSMEKVIGTFL